jgi:hypothetical protein
MAIFLAKNWLSMSDRQELEHSTKDSKPIKIIVASEKAKELTEKLINGEEC